MGEAYSIQAGAVHTPGGDFERRFLYFMSRNPIDFLYKSFRNALQ